MFIRLTVVIHTDGSKLVAREVEGAVRVWAVDLEDQVDRARERRACDFSEGECRQ